MPEASAKELIFEHLQLIFFFGIFAFVAHWIAIQKGFFSIAYSPSQSKDTIKFKQVLFVFGIYISTAMGLAPFLAKILMSAIKNTAPRSHAPQIAMMGWLQLFIMVVIFMLLLGYSRTQNNVQMNRIWKDRSRPMARSTFYDFGIGIVTWLIGFPLVVAIGQICDLFIYVIFGVENYEQVAVRYLKMTLGSPYLLFAALITILIVAPVIEEWLFRGFLQTWLKHHVGAKSAILLSALCFALFHLSSSQGVGNISLAISLFVFACYLGFIYEKQGSLFASIGLHMTFNAISSIRILLFPGP